MDYEIKEYKSNDGIRTKYAVFGNGDKAFVIISGLSIKPVTDSAELVAESYKMFGDEFTVYLFDRPLPVSEKTDIDEIAERLYDVLCALNIKEAYFFGASQGGMILQSLMINHSDIIKKAVLGSTVSRTDKSIDEKIGEWLRLAESKDTTALHLKFFYDIYSEELISSLGDNIYSLIPPCTDGELKNFYLLGGACRGFNAYGRLDKVNIPTLVIGSEKDRLMKAEFQAELAKKLDAELYLYPNFSHAVYDEAPDYKQRLYDFFMK